MNTTEARILEARFEQQLVNQAKNGKRNIDDQAYNWLKNKFKGFEIIEDYYYIQTEAPEYVDNYIKEFMAKRGFKPLVAVPF